MKPLESLMLESLSEGGAMVGGGGQDRYMEIVETSTGKVWMCLEPVSKDDFQNLNPGGEYKPLGTAKASMDAALFNKSPQSDDRVEIREISGHRFAHVASPGEFKLPENGVGPAECLVEKSHVIGFAAERPISVMRFDSETFIELIGDDRFDSELALPEGAYLEQLKFTQPIVVDLPTPTRTFWWFDKGRSFQGPVELPENARAQKG